MSEIPPFEERLQTALADPDIKSGIADFQLRWAERRNSAIAQLESQTGTSFSDLARNIQQTKTAARHNPDILNQFRSQAKKRGANIIDASTAADACAAIADICARHSTKLVVKTKSMATEEIFLNQHLEGRGITVVETDLGEWLLQVSDDRPSHLIVPAIHKRRHQIADLLGNMFERTFDPEDVQTMARVVRQELRPHFLGAGVGITGGNILIAETGSVVLVTNEGNAGLTTALPPVHIAVVGTDKLVPDLKTALEVVQVLAKSATGQVISTYTQFLNGVNLGERKGEMHIILLDNGRSQMVADERFDSALSCIRCGACANVCPPYQVVGGHAFGHVYTGAIGLVVTGFHHGVESAHGPQSLCVSCGACAEVCPAAIPLPDQILAVREEDAARRGSWRRKLTMRIFRSRRATSFAVRLGAVLVFPFRTGKTLGRLPLPKKHRWRTPPSLPIKPARNYPEMRKLLSGSSAHSPNSDSHPRLSASPTPTPPAGSPVDSPTDRGTALFLQCVCDNIAPKIALDTLKLLKHCCNTTRNTTSDTLEIPASQHCCGLPAFDSGDHETARQMAIQTLDTLEGYSRVVTPAPSCVVAVREYVQLFRNDPVLLGRSRDLAARMVDLVGFLSEPANTAKLATSFASATATPSSTPTPQLFTVHPFCQSRTRLHQTDTLTSLIRNVSGVTPVPLAEEDVCCGFGGSASLLRPETSAQILARKLAKVSKTEAGILITDNPGCALHIKGGVESSRLKIEVLHIAEFLATNLFTV